MADMVLYAVQPFYQVGQYGRLVFEEEEGDPESAFTPYAGELADRTDGVFEMLGRAV